MVLTTLILTLVLLVIRASAEGFTYPANCAKPNTVQTDIGVTGSQPPIPKLPPIFQTIVEANLIDEQRTIIAEEYYDDPSNRAVVRTIQDDNMDYLLLDYTFNQIVYIVNGVCTVKDLELDENQLLFGLENGPADIPHIYTTNAALHFAQANGLTYMGQTTVRGMNVDHWQSCMYWAILGSNFTLDYYFTANNWTDPVLFNQIPVRAEIKGVQTKNNISKTFHHMYEYFDFRTHIWDGPSVFQVPNGTTCSGLMTSKFSYPPDCAAPNTIQSISGPAPALPDLPESFQTRLEINIIDQQKSMIVTEFYDGPGNRAAVYFLENNTINSLYMDYTNDQLLTVVNGQCSVTELDTDADQLLFGRQNGPGGIPHIYSTNGALHFAKSNGLTYMGKTTVRGINVDHWQSCMYWDMLSSNFTLDYYFSAYSWTDSVLYPQVPVRAEIKGVMTSSPDLNFHHIYEYFDFRYYVWAADRKLESPKGIVCPGRKQTKAIPQLSGQYSYREEAVSTIVQEVSQYDVWYDYSYKLVRFDYRPQFAGYPYYTTNPVTEIHDYSSGVAYAIDRSLGNCTVLPIQNASFDASINISRAAYDNQKQFVVSMKSPSQMFYLDNTSYTYEGQRVIRDMLCDVYISKRTDFRIPGYTQFNSTFEFYFLADTWLASNNIGRQNAMNTDVPIRLDITTESWVNFQASYNIYNFDEENPTMNVLDVTNCYDEFSKMSFILEFEGYYDSSLFKYKRNFLQATIDTLLLVTGLPRIRIQNVDLHMDTDDIYFTGSLMETPPPLSFFQKIPGVYKQYSNNDYKTVSDAYECASTCNNGDITPCNSFEYCPKTKLCSLSSSHANEGVLIASTANCDFYARTVRSEPMEIPLGQAWENLKNMVFTGDFRIQVNLSGNNKEYMATSIDQNVLLNGQRKPSTQVALQNFDVQINKAIPGYNDLVLTGQAIDDCAASCLNQEEWICNSFDYCFDTGYCLLSKLHPDERPGVVQNEEFCDLYSKKYTANYEMLQGQTVLSSSNAVYQNIYSADECAKLCSNYQEFSCKSFDYCDYISTCYLGKNHYYDLPKADIEFTPICNHYSRNYITDFRQTARKVIANRDDRIIYGIGVTQCAKECVEEEGFSCASFDYCGNTTECRLSTASMKNIGQVSVIANLYCDVYSRQAFPDGTPYINNPEKYYNLAPAPTNNNSKYSKGAMAGLAVGMVALGVILAVVIFMVVGKLRAKPVDKHVPMSFENKEYSETVDS